MEYRILESIWRQTTAMESADYQLSREDVRQAIGAKSQTVISKIRARLKFKIWVQIVLGSLGLPLSIYLLLKGELTVALFELIIFSTVLMLGIHKIVHYRRIVKFQSSADSIKKSLTEITDIMHKVVTAQIYTSVILAVVIVSIFAYGGLEDLTLPLRILAIVGIASAAAILLYYIAKRGQQKMFGQYIDMLEDYLEELAMAQDDSRPEEENLDNL